MWIIPTNFHMPNFAPDTVGSESLSKEFFHLAAVSLMWRSKPTLAQIWRLRAKDTPWVRRLFGRTLKPSTRTDFEIAYSSSLPDIRASLSVMPAGVGGARIQDTYGRIARKLSEQQTLPLFGSKTCEGTSLSDSKRSHKIYTTWVTELKREYSARRKLVRPTAANVSLFLPTPTTHAGYNLSSPDAKIRYGLNMMERHNLWPTPRARESGDYTRDQGKKGKERLTLTGAARFWGPPKASDSKGSCRFGTKGHLRDAARSNLKAQVMEPGVVGQLNPTWVEWLMGLPMGWTDLDFAGTGSYQTKPSSPCGL